MRLMNRRRVASPRTLIAPRKIKRIGNEVENRQRYGARCQFIVGVGRLLLGVTTLLPRRARSYLDFFGLIEFNRVGPPFLLNSFAFGAYRAFLLSKKIGPFFYKKSYRFTHFDQWPKVFADVNRVLVHPLSLIDVLNRFPFRSRRCCGIWTFSGAVFVNWAAMPVSANPASSAPLRWDQKIRTRHCLFPFTLQLDSSNALQWHFYSFHFNRKRNTKWKIKVNQVPPVSQSFPTRWPPPFHNKSVTSRQAVHGNFPFFFFVHAISKWRRWNERPNIPAIPLAGPVTNCYQTISDFTVFDLTRDETYDHSHVRLIPTEFLSKRVGKKKKTLLNVNR